MTVIKPNASDTDYDLLTTWGGTKERPDSDKITAGWLANEKPPAEYFNWTWDFFHKWIKYCVDLLDEFVNGVAYTRTIVTQTSHGFTYDLVYCNGSGVWTKAIATAQATCATHFAVRINDNDFYCYTGGEIVKTGILDASAATLVNGSSYYLSKTVAGRTTTTKPSGTDIVQLCLKCDNNTVNLAIDKSFNNNILASNIANTPAGDISSVTIQAAINELDTEKAKLAGLSTQTFSVADGLAATDAVNLGQLNNKQFYTPYCANSGNTDVDGYADIVARVSDTEVSFKVGGAYPNMGITFPNGKHYVISEIPDVTNLNDDGTYTFVIYEDNLVNLGDGTYRATVTPIKIGYSLEETISTQGNAISDSEYTGTYIESAFDQNLSTEWWGNNYGSYYTPNIVGNNYVGQQNLLYKVTKIKLTQGSNGITSVKVQFKEGSGAWTDIQTTSIIATENYENIITVADYAVSGTHQVRLLANANVISGYWTVRDVQFIRAVSYAGGNITEGYTYTEDSISSILPKMLANSQSSYNVYRSSIQLDDAWRAFAQDVGNWWTSQVGAGMPQWIAMKMPSGKVLTGYGFNTGNGGGAYTFKFQGSNNTTNGSDGVWTDLDTQTFVTIATATQASYSFTNSNSYTSYRLYFTTSAQSSYVIVSNIRFYETLTTADGDLHLLINQNPMKPQVRTGGVYLDRQFVCPAKVLKESGNLGTPSSFWFNDIVILYIDTVSTTPEEIENLFNTEKVSIQIKEDGVIQNIEPTITKETITWTPSYTGVSEITIRRNF